MAFGDGQKDAELRDSWHAFCETLKTCGDLAFKDYTPANPAQRADAFRFLTQALSQAFDMGLETKNPLFPELHSFCGPHRKLGADCADFVYHQAWIEGGAAYRLSGMKGDARFFNVTVQGERPAIHPGTDGRVRNLHEPFGDIPEVNLSGEQLEVAADGSFELFIGGPRRERNWLPTTATSRKLFIRQCFDRWEEAPGSFRIERIGMDGPPPPIVEQDVLNAIDWARAYLGGVMADWPDLQFAVGQSLQAGFLNSFPAGPGDSDALAQKRGRAAAIMAWKLAPDEALIVEFEDDGFWNVTNMGSFCNSMDFVYRPVSFTPSRTLREASGLVRLVMTHVDPGYHNWIDTQGFEAGYLAFRRIGAAGLPLLSTRVVKLAELASVLPLAQAVSADARQAQFRARFDAIRARFPV